MTKAESRTIEPEVDSRPPYLLRHHLTQFLHYVSNRFLFLSVELQGSVRDTLKVMDRQDLLLEDWEWETLAGAKTLLKPFDILTKFKLAILPIHFKSSSVHKATSRAPHGNPQS